MFGLRDSPGVVPGHPSSGTVILKAVPILSTEFFHSKAKWVWSYAFSASEDSWTIEYHTK